MKIVKSTDKSGALHFGLTLSEREMRTIKEALGDAYTACAESSPSSAGHYLSLFFPIYNILNNHGKEQAKV